VTPYCVSHPDEDGTHEAISGIQNGVPEEAERRGSVTAASRPVKGRHLAREPGLAWVEAASIGSRRRAVYGAAGGASGPDRQGHRGDGVAIGARCLSGGKAV